MGDARWAAEYLRSQGATFNERALLKVVERRGWRDNPSDRRSLLGWYIEAATVLRAGDAAAPADRGKPSRETPNVNPRRAAEIPPAEWLRAQVADRALVRRANADPELLAFRARYGLNGNVAGMHPEEAVNEFFDSLHPEDREQANGDLDLLCLHLKARFGWDEYIARSVVITGENRYGTNPVAARVEVVSDSDDYTAAKIILEVDVWVSAPTVGSVYQRMQDTVRDRANRPIKKSVLNRFDRAETLEALGVKPWEEIRRRLKYKGTWRNLHRDVKERTGKSLLRPALNLSGARKPRRRK